MTVEIKVLSGIAIGEFIKDLAMLRIAILKNWPYLYEGSPDFEESYLERYARNVGAVIVGAFDEGELVGAATGQPLLFEAETIRRPMFDRGHAVEDIYSIGELLIQPDYRRQGLGHIFFEEIEQHARELGFPVASFSTVIRPDNHPDRPDQIWPIEDFWDKRGYVKVDNTIVSQSWKDLGEHENSIKLMQVWMRDLASTDHLKTSIMA